MNPAPPDISSVNGPMKGMRRQRSNDQGKQQVSTPPPLTYTEDQRPNG